MPVRKLARVGEPDFKDSNPSFFRPLKGAEAARGQKIRGAAFKPAS